MELDEFITALRERPNNLTEEERFIAANYGNAEHVVVMRIVGPNHPSWFYHSARLYTPIESKNKIVDGSIGEIK